jgi:hypothetical protein
MSLMGKRSMHAAVHQHSRWLERSQRFKVQKLYSAQAPLQGSSVGDYIVLRGQSYRVAQIDSDTQMAIRPEYKGASGTEKEFNPATAVVNTTTNRF